MKLNFASKVPVQVKIFISLIVISPIIIYIIYPKKIYSCSGIVVDESGRPIAGARTGIWGCFDEECISCSGEDGSWRIKGISPKSELISHIGGLFVTHKDYVGISWPQKEKISKVILKKPLHIKIYFGDFGKTGLGNILNVYLEDNYRSQLAYDYQVSWINQYPYCDRRTTEDGYDYFPAAPGIYKITLNVPGQTPIIKIATIKEDAEFKIVNINDKFEIQEYVKNQTI